MYVSRSAYVLDIIYMFIDKKRRTVYDVWYLCQGKKHAINRGNNREYRPNIKT